MNGESIACLSIRQPWASLVAAGIKPCENRLWPCRYRGTVLIHASKTWTKDEQGAYDELMGIAIAIGDVRRQDVLGRSKTLQGGLIGIAVMRLCVGEKEWYADGGQRYDGCHNWFVGPYGFFLTGARMFPHIVAYKGQRGLFRVPVKDVPFDISGYLRGDHAPRF